jgi:hypothetical protein
MDIGTMVKTLQDPMGIPFHPVLFQVLLVLIFAVHIMFVNFTLGLSFFSAYGFVRGNGSWGNLSRSLAKATTPNASLAILFGIAPLLFLQVVYDPFWYASNVLSAAWVLGFIVVMMLGYGLTYVFYLKAGPGRRTGFAVIAFLSFALFLLAGVIMHVLGYQLLQPEKWLQWYIVRKNGVDASGISLHAFQLPRFLHFIVPSFAMAGLFLMLYAWYFKDRADRDREQLAWVAGTGAGIAFFFSAVQALVGVWWLFSLPPEFRFFTNPFFLVAAGMGVALLFFLYCARKDPFRYTVRVGIWAFLTIFAMSTAREVLRMKYVGRFGYSIFDHKVNLDLGSTALFLCTFIAGVFIVSYPVYVAYASGRTAGQYAASPAVHRWGNAVLALLLLWIAAVVGLGIVISVKNYF